MCETNARMALPPKPPNSLVKRVREALADSDSELRKFIGDGTVGLFRTTDPKSTQRVFDNAEQFERVFDNAEQLWRWLRTLYISGAISLPLQAKPLPAAGSRAAPNLDDVVRTVFRDGRRPSWATADREVRELWNTACPGKPVPTGWGRDTIRRRAIELNLYKPRSYRRRP
jgi:hypothetical protein